jgi:hypothetical protein
VITIVSGFMRSGTSMMMRCLQAGGMELVYNPSRDEMNDRHGDEHYKINDDGFYELTRAEYMDPAFPNNCDGKAVKCLWGGMYRLKAGKKKTILFMRRPIEEIAASYEAAFGAPHPRAIPELADELDTIQAILKQRRDVKLHVVQYHDVLKNPLEVFESLGLPINPDAAAAIVNPSKYRHRAA